MLKVWNDSVIFDSLFLKGLESCLTRERDVIVRLRGEEAKFRDLPFQINCNADLQIIIKNYGLSLVN